MSATQPENNPTNTPETLGDALQRFAVAIHKTQPGYDETPSFDQAVAALSSMVFDQIIGVDETHWEDAWGDTHDVPTDTMVANNDLRTEQRKTVQGDKS